MSQPNSLFNFFKEDPAFNRIGNAYKSNGVLGTLTGPNGALDQTMFELARTYPDMLAGAANMGTKAIGDNYPAFMEMFDANNLNKVLFGPSEQVSPYPHSQETLSQPVSGSYAGDSIRNMVNTAGPQRLTASNPLNMLINPNAMPGGVGGVGPLSLPINQNAMPQSVESLRMFQDPATTPQSSTLDPNRFDAQMNTALAGMPKAAPANPWATGVDATNALGEGIWGAGKGAPSGLNPVENGMGVAGYSQTDLDMMRALDPVMFEALTGATAKDTGWSQADTNMAVNAGLAGLNIYGMFSQLGQADRSLDIAQGNLDLKQDSFDETLRHRQALVNQNKMA